MAVKVLRTNLVLEDLARQKGRKCDQNEGSREVWSTLTVRMISSELNLNHQTVHDMLTEELGMQKICAKLAPNNLTKEQTEGMCAWTFLNASKTTIFLNMS